LYQLEIYQFIIYFLKNDNTTSVVRLKPTWCVVHHVGFGQTTDAVLWISAKHHVGFLVQNQRGDGIRDVGFLTNVIFNVFWVNVSSGPDDKSLSEPTINAFFLLVHVEFGVHFGVDCLTFEACYVVIESQLEVVVG